MIAAVGEFQAAQKMADAAEIIETHPSAIQLRYLQTLVEVSTGNNTTTIFPVPIDMIGQFLTSGKGKD